MAFTFDTLQNGNTTSRAEGGRVVEVRRTGQIIGLAGNSLAEWLTEAYNQLPPEGSMIVVAGTQLRLSEHNVSIADRAVANVELVYQWTPEPFPGSFTWRDNVRMAGATQQASSSIDPSADPPSDIKLTFSGVTQGGEYTFLEPNATLEVVLYEALEEPWTLPQEWIGTVNETEWAGGGPGEWLCTNVSLVAVNPLKDPPDYEVTYQFQWRPTVGEANLQTAWQPQVVFTDPETGKPPFGWREQASAYMTINHYPSKEFGDKFP